MSGDSSAPAAFPGSSPAGELRRPFSCRLWTANTNPGCWSGRQAAPSRSLARLCAHGGDTKPSSSSCNDTADHPCPVWGRSCPEALVKVSGQPVSLEPGFRPRGLSGPGDCGRGSVLSTSCLRERAAGAEHTRGLHLGRGHRQASRTFQVQRRRPAYVCKESACWPLGAPHAGSHPRPPPASLTPAVKSFLGARPRGRRADGQPGRAACGFTPFPPVGPRPRPCAPSSAPPLGSGVGLEGMSFGVLSEASAS